MLAKLSSKLIVFGVALTLIVVTVVIVWVNVSKEWNKENEPDPKDHFTINYNKDDGTFFGFDRSKINSITFGRPGDFIGYDNYDKKDITLTNSGNVYIYYSPEEIKDIHILGDTIYFPEYSTYILKGINKVSGLDKVDTSRVIVATSMFEDVKEFNGLELANWDVSNILNMNKMFSNTNIKELKIESWKTDSLQAIEYMFRNSNIEKHDLEKFNVSNVTKAINTFEGFKTENLDVSTWNLSQVKDLTRFFYNADLTTLKFEGFKTTNAISMREMFRGVKTLQKVELSRLITVKLEDASGMFADSSMTDVGNLIYWQTDSLKDMSYMFLDCSILSLDVSGWTPFSVTNMSGAFSSASFTKLDVRGRDFSSVESANGVFENVTLSEIDLTGWKFPSNAQVANFVDYRKHTIVCGSQEEKTFWNSFKNLENVLVIIR
ncbi:MAG: BspA family leucine-rich repeat surface protein [Anaeroplasmataceae bacterium]